MVAGGGVWATERLHRNVPCERSAVDAGRGVVKRPLAGKAGRPQFEKTVLPKTTLAKASSRSESFGFYRRRWLALSESSRCDGCDDEAALPGSSLAFSLAVPSFRWRRCVTEARTDQGKSTE